MKFLPTTAWQTPKHYGGFNPIGDYCILTVHRDSGSLDRSNWIVLCRYLAAADYDYHGTDFSTRPACYTWRAGHWAVGWVDYLMLRADAPAALLEKAEALLADMDSYPVIDEDHWSKLEFDEACEYWELCSIRDRVDYLQRAGLCIFAARRAALPEDPQGALYELLRS